MTEQNPEEAIFLAALEKTTRQERVAYVEEACAGDADLQQRVDQLLNVHDESKGPLDAPPPGIGATSDMSPLSEGPGTRIGPYKLREQIGEGGFGVVYVAEQERPVRRKVALKIIKPGMDTKDVIARFEAERQALAIMDHPNVAKVLDGGATQSGRPFFVMELVHGVPVTEFCDKNYLSASQRLELFIDVCHAVQHAHQKGIIHRDLKPNNIMVTLHDGKPVPKVIDFGVSKALSQQLTEKSIYTRYGQMIGTPVYMSPEQAEMSGLGIDTRSDVYSLGVLLYELLTGTTPLDESRLRASGYAEMLRIIREEEPPRPSMKVSTMGNEATAIAEHRNTDAKKLGQSLHGELDWIVMKALDKDRSRRYESANQFAADIQHFLNDEPVQACPPSTVYRFKKFARRNYRLVATAATIATIMFLATFVSLFLAMRANLARQAELRAREAAVEARNAAIQQRQLSEREAERAKRAEQLAQERLEQAQRERRRADEQRAIAQAVNQFLQGDLFGKVETDYQPLDDLRREPPGEFLLLDRAAKGLDDGKFTDQPLTEAAVRVAIGDVYRAMQQYGPAERNLKRSIELYEVQRGAEHVDTLNGKDELAELYLDQKNTTLPSNCWKTSSKGTPPR